MNAHSFTVGWLITLGALGCGGGTDPLADSGPPSDAERPGDARVVDTGVADDAGSLDSGASACVMSDMLAGTYDFAFGRTECAMLGPCTVAVAGGTAMLDCSRFTIACTLDANCVCVGPVVRTPGGPVGSISLDFTNGTASADVDFGTGDITCDYTFARN